MKQLYYIRHGQTDDNANERWGFYDTPLSEKGRLQAIAAGRAASEQGLRFDAIIASPQLRAVETAHLVATELGFAKAQIETLDLLVERHMGEMMGRPFSDFLTNGRLYQHLDDVPGVETIEAIQQRAARALDTITARPEPAVLVVGHGTFGRAFRRAVLGRPYTDEYASDGPGSIPNATILRLVPHAD
jgi:uncharacterized phosphatase